MLRYLVFITFLVASLLLLLVLPQDPSRLRIVQAADLPAPPEISGESAVVIDGENGDILYDKDSHRRVPPASLTKIATAIVGIENGDLKRRVVIDFDSYQMVLDSQSSIMGLKPGDDRSLEDMLYGLMLPSGNDAAVVIARSIAADEASFVEMMNKKISALGLADTHFSNPHGLDASDHYSSAYDMAAMSLYGLRNPVFRSLSQTTKYEIQGNRPYDLWNLNRLLYTYDGADGVKIGFTESALETIVASATRDGQKLIVAVMRSNSRYSDARALLDYFFEALHKGQVTRMKPATPIPSPTATPMAATATPVPVFTPTPGSITASPVNPANDVDVITRIFESLRDLLSFVGF